jgi:hypothetical protein
MRFWKAIAVVAFLVSISPATAGPYLFDLLEISAYRAGWDAMLKGQKNLPAWVSTFSKTMDGVATPSEDAEIVGQTYTYATVCKPHDCGGNLLYVVFNSEGEAWGLLEGNADGDNKKDRYLGKPSEAIADALAAKARSD